MARVSTYLNFPRTTEEAFNFYKSVFGTEFKGDIQRMGSIPPQADMAPTLPENKNLVIHVELPILGGHILMGTDVSVDNIKYGNNISINLEPDTREETTRLFNALSQGGNVSMPLQNMFWGDYFGACVDKYGISWMFNCASKG
jgi:PhnB protein